MNMHTQDLKNLMDGYLGGSDERTRSWCNPKCIWSAGMYAVANEAGAHWLLDIIATEVAPLCLQRWNSGEGSSTTFFRMTVMDGSARLWLEADIGEPSLWGRVIHHTDFPEGDWTLYLGVDGLLAPFPVIVGYLPQEH